MKKQLIPIEDFLTDETYLTISGTSIFNNNSTFTLADHTAVYNELFNLYGGRAVLVRGEETGAQVFKKLFEGWKDRRKNDIASLLDAWQMKYNPIENYDATETKTGTETGVETPEDRVKTVTQTPNNWKQTETQTPTGWKEKQTPTNWKETETQTPTGWKEKQTPANWKETETQTPTNWKEVQTPTNWKEETKENKQGTEGAPDYVTAGKSKIVPFGATESVLVNENETDISRDVTVERTGTFSTERQGTYQTERSHTGTFETERLGTYQTETSHTGTFETERLGTYETETEHTGTYETKEEIEGTITNEMTYDTTFRRHGNIGIASAPDLMMKDLQARCVDFVSKFLFEFVTKYTVYV